MRSVDDVVAGVEYVEEEAAVDEGTDADSEDSHEDTNEDTLTGRGKN